MTTAELCENIAVLADPSWMLVARAVARSTSSNPNTQKELAKAFTKEWSVAERQTLIRYLTDYGA